ncbi:MAG: IPT/TIG domain-containing protein [Acidimicrobiales bacterium]
MRLSLATGAASLILACLVSSGRAAAAPLSIPSPVAGGWQLNGSAVLNTGASPPNLQLTAATNNEAGSAFYPTAVPGVGISAAFDVFIGSGSGADGLTFTLANASETQPTALGVDGGGEGFSGITGIAVSFDTWQNIVNPSNNFIGIANGPVSGFADELNYVATNTSIPAIRNTVHHIVVTTTSTGITVMMDGTQVLTYATTLPPNVLVGFTGGTGGSNDIHQVQNVVITSNPSAPTVTAVSPTSGPSTGGTSVTITGTGFTGASAVNFGTAAATSFTVNSSTSITATSPAGSGTVDVTVTTPGGTSATSAADQFGYTSSSPPTVTGVSPSSGPAAGGTSVTVTGTAFSGATAVKFASTAATSFTVNSSTSITATSPAGTGAVNVTVTTPGGTSATSAADQFSYVAAPTVTAVNPSAGPQGGGTSVTVSGTSFTGASVVKFGSSAATTFSVNSSTSITASSPAGTGTVDVTVTTPGGTSARSAADQFGYTAAPTVTSISPSAGPLAGGTSVTVVGTGLTGASAVKFGNTAAATFTVNSSSSITATSPSGSGTVDVTVTTPGGTSATSAADQFSYTAAPTVTSISPSAGPLGGETSITVTGANFTGATAVDFGSGNLATFTVNSSSSITATSPAGSGTVNIIVTTAGGTSATSTADQFLYTSAPTVTSVSPSAGPLAGGTSVTVTGANFTGATAVDFGSGNAATFTVNNPSSITATSPSGSGTVNVTVTTPGGTSATSAADQFSYVAAPTVSSVSPSSGPSAGGTSVTVTGTNLTGASAVDFGSGNTASFTVNSSTSITATSPSGSGTVNVTVTTSGGTSATSAADQFSYVAAPTVSSVSPSSGPSGGGTSVTVTGTGFTGTSAVKFGNTAAATFTVNNSSSITATSPSGSGTVNVTVTTAGGTSATSAADQFLYTLVPTVTSVSPSAGPLAGGTSVTVTGTNLTGASAVDFGSGNTASFTVNSSTSITATSPSGSGTVNVTVTTAGGTSATSAADQFSYVPSSSPVVTAVTPGSGPSGSLVTVTGANFTGATAVDFGSGNAATFTVNSSSSITATAPAGSGMVNVTVTIPGGTSATSAADEFLYESGSYSIPSPVAGGWQLNGSSVLNTGASPANLELTSVTNWQAGSAFDPTPVPGAGISATFNVFIGSGSGADGLTFILANASDTQPTALGDNGGGEGFSGIDGIAVSLDTWQNDVNPSDNFIGIANGSVPGIADELNYVATNTSIPAIRNVVHTIVVTTSSVGVTVTMDGTQVLSYATTLPPYVLVGFGGGTGGFNDIHQVQNVTITSNPPPSPPAVTAVSPTSGPSTGDTSVTITGTGFTGASAVHFGTASATSLTVNSSTSLTATSPAGSLGTDDITVTTPGGTSATSSADQYTYTPPPPPSVKSVSPTSGPSTGATTVTITGTGFAGASAVNFGTTAATFTVNSSTTITAISPAGSLGTVDITVTTSGGTSATSGADQFTYTVPPPPTVTSISPTSGQSTGDTSVTITGTSFTGATAVDFGSGNPATFTVNNASTITATSPPGALATVDVTVTTPGGTSTTSAADKYTYTVPPPPTVSAVSPTSGISTGGASVTITGTNFTGATAVSFAKTAANFTVNSPTSITAISPPSTPGPVDITVTTPGGTSATSPADQFTYTVPPPPTVSAVSPNTGPDGSLVTITGTNFLGTSVVDFGSGDPAANFAVNNSTTITAIAPTGSPGTIDITVRTGGGTSGTSSADQFTFTSGSAPYDMPSPVLGGWQLNGSSVLNTSASPANLELTGATNWQAGSAFYPTPVVSAGVTVSFDAFIGSGTGADGLTLTLADASGTAPTALGVNGGGEGFSGIAGYAISLDTWQNSVNPSNNFVGIANGPIPGASNELNYVATSTSIPQLQNNVQHIVVTTSSTGIVVWMNGIQVLNYATSLPPYLLVGFTAGTGGFNDVHQVQNVFITATSVGVPPPSVTSISPNSGPGEGGTAVTITGTNLTGATAIAFGPNEATGYTINSSTSIIAAAPAGTGTVDVQVTTLGGTSATSAADQYNYVAAPPTVTGVTPNSGPTTGGTVVTITGTNFLDADAITFGPSNVASTFSVINDTTIVATAPSGQLGTFDVQVSNPAGASPSTSADEFTYTTSPVPTVTGISPSSGGSTGGTVVTITGTGLSNASTVDFGAGNPSASYTVNSPTSITATAPPGSLGTVDITVMTDGGASATSAADQFTYAAPPPPSVTGVSPSSGPNGSFVTITGSNLMGATVVNFGAGNPATSFTVGSASAIYATAPPGSGTVDITVTTAGGTSSTSTADEFTYTIPSPPTVTAVSPNTGFSGYSVIVTGTGFTSTSAVYFAGVAASFTVNSDTSITATAPAGSGIADVTVSTAGGTSTITAADEFTYSTGTAPPTMVATYRGGLARSGYYPTATGLTPANVTSLKLHWTDTGGTGTYAQPIVANNMVYWGDWNGNEHGTTLSGTDVWTTNLGVNTDSSCNPPVVGVAGTATAAMLGTTPVLYVPGGTDNFYMLNALTGAIMWETNLGTPPGDFLWSSPILYNGNVYEGVASFGDCPLVQGQLVEMNATTGVVEHVADMAPNGCIGGGIWSSPAIDTSDGSIYVTTGTPNGCEVPGELSPAIIKLRASDLTILSSWTVPQSQIYDDPDFGSTPTLFTAVINGVPTELVGAINKNGIFYAWDRNDLAAGPVWQTRIADPAGGPLSIVSATWDGTRLYVGGGNALINGASCYENISALNPATGDFIWRACVQGSMTSGITEVPGILIMGYGASGNLLFLNPANGATLLHYLPAAGVEGETTVSNGIVYVPLDNGNLIALGQ